MPETERTSMRLRLVRDGVLEPQPIAGLPEDMSAAGGGGLMSVAVHPRPRGRPAATPS